MYKGLLISARENIDVLFRKNALLKCLCIISRPLYKETMRHNHPSRENIDVLFRKNALLKCLCIISNICLRSLDSLIIDLFWGVGNYKKLILVRLYFDSGLTHISH